MYQYLIKIFFISMIQCGCYSLEVTQISSQYETEKDATAEVLDFEDDRNDNRLTDAADHQGLDFIVSDQTLMTDLLLLDDSMMMNFSDMSLSNIDMQVELCPSGSQCDDGNLCTHSDQCNDQGECEGISIECSSDHCIERNCNGTEQCTEMIQVGRSCDDGELCTHSDQCNDQGICEGITIDCSSNTCVDRSCNGSDRCDETVHTGRVCGVTENPCEERTCAMNGNCVTSSLVDGTTCGETTQRCCTGSCVNIAQDRNHCGGCGLSCFGTLYQCIAYQESGTCACVGNVECRTDHQTEVTCYMNRCNCLVDDDCAAGQTCQVIAGVNFCRY